MQQRFGVVQGPLGNAIAGASVTVRTSPGGVLATLYSDDGVTSLANPVTTNRQGEYSYYAANGRYSETVSGTGFTSETNTDTVLLNDPSDLFFDPGALGADPTGVADSTSVFNAISALIRAAVVSADYTTVPIKVTISQGRWSVSSWDLTNIKARRVQIHMHGSTILARTASKHVIDLIGSRFVSLHGGVVYSSSSVVAKSAIQLGPVGTETSGNNAIYDFMAVGYYSHAPLMNLGSETTTYWGSTFLNRNTSATAYAAIFDGNSKTEWLPTSDYAAITRIAGDGLSFTNNAAYGCQFRNEGGGSACWGAKMEGFTFDRGCYYLSFNDSAWVIYSTALRNKGLSINGQFENSQNDNPTPGNIGIRYCFTFDNDGTNTAVDGFECNAFGPQCETFFMRNIGSGTLRISDADLRVQSLSQAGALFFGTSGSIAIDGRIETQSASKLNLNALTQFSGTAYIDDRASLHSIPPTGTNMVFSRADQSCYTRGLFLPLAEPASFTPEVTFATPGDLSVSYSVQVGRYVVLAGGAAYVEVSLTFTPTYTTASGEMRISGLPNAMQSLNVSGVDHALPLSAINSAFTWPASATQVVARLNSNSTNFRIYGLGNGIGPTIFTTAHVPSGTAKTITFSGVIMPKPN